MFILLLPILLCIFDVFPHWKDKSKSITKLQKDLSSQIPKDVLPDSLDDWLGKTACYSHCTQNAQSLVHRGSVFTFFFSVFYLLSYFPGSFLTSGSWVTISVCYNYHRQAQIQVGGPEVL